MRILVTGSDGFIGKNLVTRLKRNKNIELDFFVSGGTTSNFERSVKAADQIVHLAGSNRPDDEDDFKKINTILTKKITTLLNQPDCNCKRIIFSSTTKAEENSSYGISKLNAEIELNELTKSNTEIQVSNIRFPGIFGKWSKPNYNSVVATFSHNIINGIPIDIHDQNAVISLLYIDDAINIIEKELSQNFKRGFHNVKIKKIHNISVGSLAKMLQEFKELRTSKKIFDLSDHFKKALYSTFISFYKENDFFYGYETHEDERGIFSEFLKSSSFGQISYFTVNPGKIRGNHYHHTKTEKFLVLSGKLDFKFKSIISNDVFIKSISDKDNLVIESIPGWQHSIENKSKSKAICLVWANEMFDNENPDTFVEKII